MPYVLLLFKLHYLDRQGKEMKVQVRSINSIICQKLKCMLTGEKGLELKCIPGLLLRLQLSVLSLPNRNYKSQL